MPTPIDRETQTPCGWCGRAITQPGGSRRKRRYCDRNCRQRAYEVRTAQARLDRDLAAGRIQSEPAERVIERVVQPRHPTTAAAWVSALENLDERLRSGRIGFWDRPRLRPVVARIQEVVGADHHARTPTGAAPRAVVVQVLARLGTTSAARGDLTTLTKLAVELGDDVEQIREVLGWLVDQRALVVERTTTPATRIDPRTVAEHVRFALALPAAGV